MIGCGQMDLIKEAIVTAEQVFLKNSNFIRDLMSYRCDLVLMNIIVNENIYLEPYPFKKEDLCGMLIIDEYEKTLVYNKNQTCERRNFTIAHELGHYFLHRDKEVHFADRTKDILEASLNRFEMQANVFASQLLLPNFIIFNLLSNDLHYYQIKKKVQVSNEALYWRLVNYLINNYNLNNNTARKVVSEFQYYSIESMKNRIHHKCASIYSIIAKSTQQNFFAQ